MKKNMLFSTVLVAILLTGCLNKADTLGADVYDENDLNMQQDAKTIEIINLLPAKVRIKNNDNQRAVQTFAGILGAVGGAILGHKLGGNSHEVGAATAGGVLGGTLGAGAGAMVDDTKMIEAVTIGYKEGGKIKTSTQAGRICQFKTGTALLITTKYKETRIQPNSVCVD